MRLRNRNRYRNSVRLPVILFFVIVGGLVGTRWVKEVRARHVALHLSTEVRELDHSLTTLRRDIQDLRSRYSALTTEDALTRVDEVRVDGQTQSIQVQPKNGAPADQIQPLAPGQTPGASAGRPTGNAGRSSWRVLDF